MTPAEASRSPRRVLAIGECMVELTRTAPRELRLAYAGDAANTAVSLARLGGLDVRFLTATGDDPLCDELVGFLRAEGVAPIARRFAGASPALYLVSTDATGERSFTYYRDASPVRRLLDDGEPVEGFDGVDLVYFTAVTLQLLTPHARARLLSLAARARERGARVAFDGNYRPAGWASPEAAREAIAGALAVTDLTLPSLDDEQLLHGDRSAREVIERHRAAGVAEIVVKAGAGPVTSWSGGRFAEHAGPRVESPLDTTGAGDAFDAGYLHARLGGAAVAEAVAAGRRIAATVVRHRGAIIERSAFFAAVEADDLSGTTEGRP